jgi:hypothetical protein
VARIIGGIGTSHVPTIGLAVDRGKQHDWAPLFAGYAPVAKWLAEKRPDGLVYFYNDHATTFHFDHYPTFALGVGARFAIAHEGLGPRKVPPIRSHPALARHLAQSLVYDEFDLAVFHDLPLDHGCNSPLTMLWPRKVHQSYYLPMTMAVALFEEPATGAAPATGPVRHRQRDGIEALAGTYLFDLERSAAALRLNRFLHGLIAPENRALFRELLHAREARARERRVQLRDGRRDARRAAGGVSQDPQRARRTLNSPTRRTA